MKVVVSGATGFIGRALVQALAGRGDEIIALTRDPAKAAGLGPSVQALAWQPPQPGAWMDALSGADGVVNLAGEPIVNKPWTRTQKERLIASRVASTRAIVEAIRHAEPRPGVLVNQSAIGYYGSPGATPVTEESPAGDDFPAFITREWEAAARPAEALGVRLVILRTGIVLGAGGGALPPMTMPFRFFAGGTMGNPDQWFSWIHLEDEVGLIVYALTHDEVQGVVNATAPNPVTMDVFSHQIGEALGRPALVPFYGTFMRLALGPERGKAALASQRVLPAAAQSMGYEFRYPESGAALRAILAR
ncbi:MAG TPA: TIGR01777 family oxidoreductase [Chloroflexota bacterium]|nr:TIGR01777 family oxidoreductase [Chloroflexota bacterium]